MEETPILDEREVAFMMKMNGHDNIVDCLGAGNYSDLTLTLTLILNLGAGHVSDSISQYETVFFLVQVLTNHNPILYIEMSHHIHIS